MVRQRFLVIVILIFFSLHSFAQQSYSAVDAVQLMEDEAWFDFKKVYDANKDTYNEFFQLKADSYLNTYFNKPEKAIERLEIIANEHAESLGLDVVPFLDLLAKNYVFIQRYDKAHEIFSYLCKSLPNVLPPDNLHQLKETTQKYAALKELPQHEVIFDVNIEPVPIDTIMGGLINLPFKSGQIKRKAIFDTGANMNFVTKSLASKLGIKPILNSVMGNIDRLEGAIGVLDTFYIGNTLVKNALFYVLPDQQLILKNNNLDLIIGIETMKLMQKIEFDFNKMQLKVVPTNEIDGMESNMLLKGNMLFVRTVIDNKYQQLQYDSGFSGDVTLNKNNQTFILLFNDANIKEQRFLTASDTIIQNYKYAVDFDIKVANEKITLPIIYYGALDNWGLTSVSESDGIIGKTFTEEFSKLELDFVNMRIEASR